MHVYMIRVKGKHEEVVFMYGCYVKWCLILLQSYHPNLVPALFWF